MNPDQLDLARRLAAHSRFELRAGMSMRTRYGKLWRVTFIMGDGTIHFATGSHASFRREAALVMEQEDCPDLTDDATGGVLWEMAGKPLIVGVGESGFISLQGPEMPEHGGATLMFGGDTLAEACARALLAEWGEA